MSDENQTMIAEQGLVAMLNKSDIEQQITTAHKFPRSIKTFLAKATALVTLTEETADDCIYALPRFDSASGENKSIEGPSVRFAEIIAHAWGNSRSGARVIEEGDKFVTSQGVFHDLETNVAVTFHVQRRITGKGGRRYNDDMIGVTGNAASAIAYRNAVLKGVPKAFWQPIYEEARRLLLGNVKTLTSRRDTMLAYYQKLGVEPAKVFTLLGINGVEDITLEHLLQLKGLATAIKDGETSIEKTFSPRANAAALNERLKGEGLDGDKPRPETGDTGKVPHPDEKKADAQPDPAAGAETAQEGAGAAPAEPATGAGPEPAAADAAQPAQAQEAKPRTRRRAPSTAPAAVPADAGGNYDVE